MQAVSRTLAVVAALIAVAGSAADAQRPKMGVGIVGGTILGSQLAEYEFSTVLDGEEAELVQAVDLRRAGILGAEAEVYLTDHVALRAHAARGSGTLSGEAYRDTIGDGFGTRFSGDFGSVDISAVDAGISVWPWAPRSVGFAPFVTVGYGIIEYDFSPVEREDGGLQSSVQRRRNALLIGAGADMRIWQSIGLRFEAVNHRVETPLRASDFDHAPAGGAPRNAGFHSRINNVRLVIGAHVYLPWGSGLSTD